MRTWLVVCAALSLAVACLPGQGTAQNAGQERKELIAVMDLQAVQASPAEAQALSDRLREVMLKTGRFKLVERSQIDQVLNEQALQQAACTSQECAVQVGRILGVRKLVVGKVVKVSDKVWLLSAVLLDVESAETLRAESVRHKGDYFALMDVRVREIGQLMAAPAEAAPVVVASAETQAMSTAPTAPAAGLPDSGMLSGEQIRVLVTGNVLTGAGSKDKWTVRYEPDGSAVLQDRKVSDSGRWWVQQDKLCTKWSKVREGKVGCSGVRRESGPNFVLVGGDRERPATAQHLPQAGAGGRTYRLAVFPGLFTGQYVSRTSNGRPNAEWIVKGMRDALVRDNRMDVAFSYYEGFGIPAITHRVSEDRTWKGLLFKEVDRDYVRTWARDLKADAALAVSVSIPGNGGPLEVYLYDALRDRWYEHAGRWQAGKLGQDIKAAIGQVVTEFKERNP
jgi:TolB-like protein